MQSTSPVLRHSIAIRTTKANIPSWPPTFRAQCLECSWSGSSYESEANAVNEGRVHQQTALAASIPLPHGFSIRSEKRLGQVFFTAHCLECNWRGLPNGTAGDARSAGELHQRSMTVMVQAQPGAAVATGGGMASGPVETESQVSDDPTFWREGQVPEWRQVIDILRNRGYDVGRWQVEIGRRFREYFLKVAGDLLDEMDIDPIGEYHNDAQRRALVEIMTQVAVRALQVEPLVEMDPRTIDLSSVLTNKRFKQLFEGIE